MDTTKLNQIEKNLLVFLDSTGNKAMEDCKYVRAEDVGFSYFFKCGKDSLDEKIIYSFTRRQLWKYFLIILKKRLCGDFSGVRSFLYINDGILSSMFEAKNITGYRNFAKWHLPKPEKILKKITRFAPLMLRAEQIFIIDPLNKYDFSIDVPDVNVIKNIDFMFFSNISGKLILTYSDNFNSNSGLLLKTTANIDYVNVMEKEFERIYEVSLLLGKTKLIPAVGHKFKINGRYCYFEDYIHGNSMLKVLRDIGRKEDVDAFIEQIEKLDHWYNCYVSIFNGDKKPIKQIYEPILNNFFDIYCMNDKTKSIIERVTDILSEIDKCHPGFECVVSHNDLWPGNFICHDEGLTAVDWERATVSRAPIFDYYWMMISAAITFLLSRICKNNYSSALRHFFMNRHICCLYVHEKLNLYLRSLGISEKHHKYVLLLFLLELSMQGYMAIGIQTKMDKFIYDELINYSETINI